jgi:hypothetical protein
MLVAAQNNVDLRGILKVWTSSPQGPRGGIPPLPTLRPQL